MEFKFQQFVNNSYYRLRITSLNLFPGKSLDMFSGTDLADYSTSWSMGMDYIIVLNVCGSDVQ